MYVSAYLRVYLLILALVLAGVLAGTSPDSSGSMVLDDMNGSLSSRQAESISSSVGSARGQPKHHVYSVSLEHIKDIAPADRAMLRKRLYGLTKSAEQGGAH